MSMQLYNEYADPLESSYVGKAQRATFAFSVGPEQFDFINNFFANQYINECRNAVSRESPGDNVLHLQVYRDTSPTWQTDYKLLITATDRTGNPLPWLAIIGLALIAIAIVYFVIRPTLQSVTDLIYGPGGGDGGGDGISGIPWIGIGIIILAFMMLSKSKKTT